MYVYRTRVKYLSQYLNFKNSLIPEWMSHKHFGLQVLPLALRPVEGGRGLLWLLEETAHMVGGTEQDLLEKLTTSFGPRDGQKAGMCSASYPKCFYFASKLLLPDDLTFPLHYTVSG